MVPLAALAEPGSRLAPGARDVRGWEARTLVDDCPAGHVRELLVDEAGHVRWLVLELQGGRCVLLPAGQGRADRARRRIWVPGFARDQLGQLPEHDLAAGAPDAEREAALLAAYDAALLREPTAPPELPPIGDVVPLSSMPDLRVAEGESDPRGWTVRGTADEPLAQVVELLVDTTIMKVRHLVCRVDGEAGRRVLLPIGYAHLDAEREAVCIARLTAADLAELPAWAETAAAREGARAAALRLGAARSPGEDPRLDASALFGESDA